MLACGKGKRLCSILMTFCLLLACTFTVFAVATDIRMSVSQVTIQSGGTYQLSAIITPSSSSKSLRWSSSNSSVVSVNSNGLVTGRSSGTATITCTTTDGSNLSASCTVTVAQLITSISLSTNSIEVYTGSSQRVNVNITPSSATGQNLKWSSSNTSIASVNNGVITGVSPGSATITCVTTDGSKKSASCTVTVKQGVTLITLNKSSVTLGVGNSTQLTASVSPSNASNKSVSWSSSNSGIATVNGSGQVTAVSSGSAVITCRSNDGTNITASCTVSVATVSGGNGNGNGSQSQQSPATPTTEKKPSPVIVDNSSENALPTNDEVEGETTELSEEEFNKAVEEIFNEDTTTDDTNKYNINDMLKPQLSNKKKKEPLSVSWTAVKGFSGYEIYVAVGDKNKEDFNDEDYISVGITTGNHFEIQNYQNKKAYSVKVRTYITNLETGEIEYSDFTKAVNINTKSESLWDWIKGLFDGKEV